MDSITFSQPAIRQQIYRPDFTVDPLANTVADFELAAQPLTFNDQGVCTSPETKLIVDKALMSPTCPVWIKNALLKNAEAYPEQLRELLQGILTKGAAVQLQGTSSTNLDIRDLDFSGGKFQADGAEFTNLNAAGTNFSGGSFNDVVINSGDLTNAVLKLIECDAGFAIRSNMVITDGMKLGATAKEQMFEI